MVYSGAPSTVSLWIYTLANNSWTSQGTMYNARSGHIVLPVDGVKCPQSQPGKKLGEVKLG